MVGGILVMGGLGLVVGVGLALASKIFYVYVDPKIEAIEESLPGANCGGCGLPGCGANAIAILEGSASAASCVAGGPELAAEISEILGVKLEAREPDFAIPGCTYGFQDCDQQYHYRGINDCRAAALLSGGTKVCPIGCLGLGTCVKACPFDALSIGPDNLPVVNLDRCTGCGTCERVCPKRIITLTSNSRRIQAEYTTDECTAPCQRTCPAGINIPAYIGEISRGNYLNAVRIIKETNPFPLVCGRICVHPCEYECRRNLVDEPVAINFLKRFAADHEMKSGQRVQIPRAPESGRSIAVIGGGAEGLTAAYFLNRLGHDATVYEATSQFGGLLRKGLPANRLPRDVLDWEINGIFDAGVNARAGKSLGRDITIDRLLKDGCSAVLITIGGWDTQISEGLRNEGTGALPGLRLLVDFLMAQRAGEKVSIGKNVLVLGGGKAALEAASTCLEHGSEKVHVLFRSSPENLPFTDEELKQAEDNGVMFHFRSALIKMIGEDERLTHVEIVRITEEGLEDEKIILPADSLLTGTGRFPELIYVPRKGSEVEEGEIEETPETVRWETVTPYPGPFAEDDIGIFRPGEAMGDYKAIVEAIGAGRRTANSAHRFLTGAPIEAPTNMIRKNTSVLTLSELEPVSEMKRLKMPELQNEEQITNPTDEVALGYSEDQALKEAKRCLKCGLICYRRIEGELH